MPPARSWRVAAACVLVWRSCSRRSRRREGRAHGSQKAAPLRWRQCDRGECATLAVPLDYAAPDGRTIDVALFRVRALDPERRIGSLLVNPGGPGASGVDFARQAAFALPESIRAAGSTSWASTLAAPAGPRR